MNTAKLSASGAAVKAHTHAAHAPASPSPQRPPVPPPHTHTLATAPSPYSAPGPPFSSADSGGAATACAATDAPRRGRPPHHCWPRRRAAPPQCCCRCCAVDAADAAAAPIADRPADAAPDDVLPLVLAGIWRGLLQAGRGTQRGPIACWAAGIATGCDCILAALFSVIRRTLLVYGSDYECRSNPNGRGAI